MGKVITARRKCEYVSGGTPSLHVCDGKQNSAQSAFCCAYDSKERLMQGVVVVGPR